MMELVSQAEKEGVTLAAMVSREMSAEEMDITQLDLVSRLSDNYAKIEHFMSGVDVPSIEEILSKKDHVFPRFGPESVNVLSDADGAEEGSE